MSERLTDDQIASLERIIRGDDGVGRMFPWMARALDELKERRAADLSAGHMQRIGAVADALPVNEEAERMATAALNKARAGHVSRKLTMPALTAEEVDALRFARDLLDNDTSGHDVGRALATLDKLTQGGGG